MAVAGAALAFSLGPAAISGGLERAEAKPCAKAGAVPQASGVAQARGAVACVINKARRRHGLRLLKASGALRDAATRHSRHMVSRRCFAHTCPGEPNLLQRVLRTPDLPCTCAWGIGENIAWGSGWRGRPRAIVRAWMDSPPHRANILNRRFKHIGVGVVSGSPAGSKPRSGTYTTNFGYNR